MLLTTFLDTADRCARKPAVRDESRELTYNQLVSRAAALARIVASESSRPNVGVLLPSSTDAVAAFYAILWTGRVVVPLNVLLNPSEISTIVQDAGVDLILSCSALEKVVELLPAQAVFLDRLPQGPPPAPSGPPRFPAVPESKPDDLAVILYTSGTTATPRGVCLSHNNLHSNASATVRHVLLRDDDRFLGVLPLSHSFGLLATLILPTLFGATVEYQTRFQPVEVLRALAGGGISVFMAAASMFAAIARVKNISSDMLRGLRIAVSGGEALPDAVFKDCRTRLDLAILQGYGLTETSPVVSVNQPWAHRPGTIGLPIPDVEVSIRDEQGQALPPDEQGEVCVRGPNVMQGYLNRPQDTAAVLMPDGWLRTGDLGRQDADGYTTMTGRKKELIIVAGENVFPREIENVLDEHPAVCQSAVIGVPDPRRGEVVVGFVVPKDGAPISAIELRDYCRRRLASFKVPRQIIIHRDLPRGPTGKIAKRLLPTATNIAEVLTSSQP
jgi:long-chain acyl-CoA synthetase